MYVEHIGKMTVRNLNSDEKLVIEFKKKGWNGKHAYEVEGFLYNSKKEKVYTIFGHWNKSLYIRNL